MVPRQRNAHSTNWLPRHAARQLGHVPPHGVGIFVNEMPESPVDLFPRAAAAGRRFNPEESGHR